MNKKHHSLPPQTSKKMIKYILPILICFFALPAFSQTVIQKSDNDKPQWFNQVPQGKSGVYTYYIGNGTNENLENAIRKAVSNVIQQVNEEKGMTYQIKTVDSTTMVNTNSQGTVKTTENLVSYGTVIATGEKINIKLKIVETYWEKVKNGNRIQYECAVLVRVPKTKQDPDLALYSKDQGAVWRSALVSGWGQLYKKEKGKGFVMLTGECVGVAGILLGAMMSSNNTNSANQTLIVKDRAIYLDNAVSWDNVMYSAAIFTGAVYLYSLIDAMTGRTVKVYSNIDKPLQFYPSYNQYGCLMTMKMRF